MQITVRINTNHAAFKPIFEKEVARILRGVANQLTDHDRGDAINTYTKLVDINGDICGSITVIPL